MVRATADPIGFLAAEVGERLHATAMPEATVGAILTAFIDAVARERDRSAIVACAQGNLAFHLFEQLAEHGGSAPSDTIITTSPDPSAIVIERGHPLAAFGCLLAVSPTLTASIVWWGAEEDEEKPGTQGPTVANVEAVWSFEPAMAAAALALVGSRAEDQPEIRQRLERPAAIAAASTPDLGRISRLTQAVVTTTGSARVANQARLDAIGHAATWIAHTVNNALTPILLAAEIGAADPDPGTVKEMFDAISHSARRGGQITQQLLAAGTGSRHEGEHASLTAAARTAIDAARQDWPASVALLDQLPEDPLMVPLSAPQAEFIVSSLLRAARTLAQPNDAVPVTAWSPPDHLTALDVSCSGGKLAVVGFRKSMGPDASSPFSEGEGLGLALTRLIVESLGGSTAVATHPGNGTTFRIIVPQAS